MNLAIWYGSDENAARATSAELTGLGGEIVILGTDIRDRDGAEALFRLALDGCGRIAVVAAGAGVEVIDRTFADLGEESVDRVVYINVEGAFFALQQAARHVVDGGRVVATSSAIALHPPDEAGVDASTRRPCG